MKYFDIETPMKKMNGWERSLQELNHMMSDAKVKRKGLQEICGFLNYIGDTYPLLLSYILGLHLTIDGGERGVTSLDGGKDTMNQWRMMFIMIHWITH